MRGNIHGNATIDVSKYVCSILISETNKLLKKMTKRRFQVLCFDIVSFMYQHFKVKWNVVASSRIIESTLKTTNIPNPRNLFLRF